MRNASKTRAAATYRVGDLATVVHTLDGPADPAFVLVHGVGVSSRYFRPVAEELVKHGTVHMVDLPGHGSSPTAGRDVTISDHAEVVAGFIEESGLDNPVIVGHSMGSQIVSRMAVDAPWLSDRIVLMSPTMPIGERSMARGATLLLADLLHNPLAADIVIITDTLFRAGLPFFLEQCRQLFGDRVESRLEAISARTLVISGDKDLVVPVDWVRFMANEIPDARLEIVNGPHVIMYSDPVRVAELIVEHAGR